MRTEEQLSVMCGRFTLFEPDKILSKEFGVSLSFGLAPRYNIAPSQRILAVRVAPTTGQREFAMTRWGLIPHWAKDTSIGNRLINARSETVAEKPAFRRAFRERRCLVPADGFYEWKQEAKGKRPFYVRMRDARPFAFAGLWERWEGIAGEAVETCAILTTAANTILSPVHDRMPVILPPEAYSQWLDPSARSPKLLSPLLHPFPDNAMEAFPVDTFVNNPKMEDPRCIIAIDSSP